MRSFLLVLLVAAGAIAHNDTPDDDYESPLWVRSGKWQGDIVLLPEQEFAMRTGVIGAFYRWNNGEMCYRFRDGDWNEDQKNHIRGVLEFYNQRTCVIIRECPSAASDYVLVTREDSGCWSYVGYVGWALNPQQLNLQDNAYGTCLTPGTILHEFLHAWGWHHTQCATNRDQYVRILWENIGAGAEGNFERLEANVINDYGCGYDFDSVMHYGKRDFSWNGGDTIQAIDGSGRDFGNSVGLTDQDIRKLNCMYSEVTSRCSCAC